ncbi:MAG: hypothetical protein PHV59_10095 [Victivallales bacterium]|nr:hypothetical protein [Victivallales bacterium]
MSTINKIEKKEAKTGFKTRGFYLFSGWSFNYPFSLRKWHRIDYLNMFKFLRELDMQRVMLWPLTEIIPFPLSYDDKAVLAEIREIINDAQKTGLECWIARTPNLASTSEISDIPFAERDFFSCLRTYRFDDEKQYREFIKHLKNSLQVLNNADGYVIIDGDPGGYPDAKPEDFIRLFHDAGHIIKKIGSHPQKQKLIPWIWCGWGLNRETGVVWKPGIDIRPSIKSILSIIKKKHLPEPWELLPGRSMYENKANGRINFGLIEELGLLPRSTLMLYEIIEFEPSPPAVVVQFDEIRRVILQESKYANICRGVFGNAQQPIMALQNLFFFARASRDISYLYYPDEKILEDLAVFLGGPAEILVPAWLCLHRGLDEIPMDLPQKLLDASLRSEAAGYIPGGSTGYLKILSDLVQSRLTVLKSCSGAPQSNKDCAQRIVHATEALIKWWRVHQYTGTGQEDCRERGFDWKYTHYLLKAPLIEWVNRHVKDTNQVSTLAVDLLIQAEPLERERAEAILSNILCAKKPN